MLRGLDLGETSELTSVFTPRKPVGGFPTLKGMTRALGPWLMKSWEPTD